MRKVLFTYCWLLVLECICFSNVDRVSIAFDKVEWHTFAGRYRDSKIVFYDGSTCLEKTYKHETVFQRVGALVGLAASESFRQLCMSSFRGDSMFALCESGKAESGVKKCDLVGSAKKRHTSFGCAAMDIVGLCHPHMQYVSPEYNVNFTTTKNSGDQDTDIEVYNTPNIRAVLNKDQVLAARITISGQGMKHGEAKGVEIWRFSDAIDMDMLILIAAKNLQAYAKNRAQKWITDKIARSVRALNWQELLSSSPSVRKCLKGNCFWDTRQAIDAAKQIGSKLAEL